MHSFGGFTQVFGLGLVFSRRIDSSYLRIYNIEATVAVPAPSYAFTASFAVYYRGKGIRHQSAIAEILKNDFLIDSSLLGDLDHG